MLKSSAVISECGKYRYQLKREWDMNLDEVIWIMLNPSTADSCVDDPTIRKCTGYSKRLGYGSITVINLFAFRTTNPAELKRVSDPYGPLNKTWHKLTLEKERRVIVAWGRNGSLYNAGDAMLAQVGNTSFCFGTTKNGQPKHPLMLPYDTPLRHWKV